jgi:hypothetical protein
MRRFGQYAWGGGLLALLTSSFLTGWGQLTTGLMETQHLPPDRVVNLPADAHTVVLPDFPPDPPQPTRHPPTPAPLPPSVHIQGFPPPVVSPPPSATQPSINPPSPGQLAQTFTQLAPPGVGRWLSWGRNLTAAAPRPPAPSTLIQPWIPSTVHPFIAQASVLHHGLQQGGLQQGAVGVSPSQLSAFGASATRQVLPAQVQQSVQMGQRLAGSAQRLSAEVSQASTPAMANSSDYPRPTPRQTPLPEEHPAEPKREPIRAFGHLCTPAQSAHPREASNASEFQKQRLRVLKGQPTTGVTSWVVVLCDPEEVQALGGDGKRFSSWLSHTLGGPVSELHWVDATPTQRRFQATRQGALLLGVLEVLPEGTGLVIAEQSATVSAWRMAEHVNAILAQRRLVLPEPKKPPMGFPGE